MKILVTGANGLLGQKLSAILDQDNEVELIATARSPLSLNLKNGSFAQLDITDQAQVTKVVSSQRPDVIINTAAMTQVDQCETDREQCWLANTTAVQFLVATAEKYNSKLIHVSTDFIFDGTMGPLAEEAEPRPVNYYGESKLAAERIIQQSNCKWAIVRTVLVYGITADLSRSNIVLWVKKSLEDGKTINVVNDQYRTPTLAEDLAERCMLVAEKKAKGIFHISGKEMMTPYDIAMETADYFGLNKNLIKATDSSIFKQPAARPLKTGFDIRKAVRELGYSPHSFKEGLAILATQIASKK